MKTKDEAFNQLQEFKAEMENQTIKNIKVLRSDNRGEYTSNFNKNLGWVITSRADAQKTRKSQWHWGSKVLFTKNG